MKRVVQLALAQLVSLRVIIAIVMSVGITATVVTPLADQALEARRENSAAQEAAALGELAPPIDRGGESPFPPGATPEGQIETGPGTDPTLDATPEPTDAESTPEPRPGDESIAGEATPTPEPTTGPDASATPTPLPGLNPPTPTTPPGPTATPGPTTAPGPTATPGPTTPPGPTATPGPTVTPAPTATPQPSPTPTPTPDTRADIRVVTNSPGQLVAGIETAATITVFNDGPAVAPGTVLTVISDNASLAAPGCTATDDNIMLVCELGQLPAESWNDIVVGVTPLSLEPVTVIASGTSAAVDPNPDNDASGFVVSVFESTDLAITAGPIQSSTGSDGLTAGETVTIPFVVVNNGPTPDADGVSATIDLAGLSPTILPPGCLADSTDPDRVACSLTTLTSQPLGFTFEAIVDGGTDVATVDATISGPGIDPDPTNNRATLEAEVVASADLSIELAPVGNLTRNGPGFVAVEVANAGPSSAAAVTITLSAEGADAVATRHDDPGCSFDDGVATCTIDQFAAGASTTYYVRLDVGDVDTVTITATVTADTTDPDVSNNVAVTGPDNPPYFTVGNAPRCGLRRRVGRQLDRHRQHLAVLRR